MLEALQWIVDFIATLVDFVINFIESLVNFITLIPSVLSFTAASVSYLPTVFQVFVPIGIIISVTYIILGRDDGQ